MDYFFHAYKPEEYLDALFPSIRYKNNLEWEIIYTGLKKKLTQKYLGYADESVTYEKEWYGGKGFVYSIKAFKPGQIGRFSFTGWDADAINQEMVEYFEKIVLLCRQNGAELIMMTAPIPPATLTQMGNYDEAYGYIRALAEENGLKYYDFNLVRPEVLARRDEDFYDAGHMNGMFAGQFSAVAAQVLKEHDEGTLDMDKYFYASFDELSEELDTITHVWLTLEEQKDGVLLTADAGYGKNVTPEYCFLYKKAGRTPLPYCRTTA